AKDAYTSDLAKVYATASPETQAQLLSARQQVTKGRELSSQSKIAEGTALLAGARLTFEKAGDVPEMLETDSAIAHGAVVQPDLAKAQELLPRIVHDCESNNYKWLLAQALTDRAHLDSNLNNYSEAISYSNDALQLYENLQDISNVLGNLTQLSTLYPFWNDTETSLPFVKLALVVSAEESA